MSKTKEKMKYPPVRCDLHPPAPGYIICDHIKSAKNVRHLISPAERDGLGEILCGLTDHPVEQLHLICASCAEPFLPQDYIC